MSVAIEDDQLNAVRQFARSAEAFCTLMENQSSLTDEIFVRRCASVLATLYTDALALPDLSESEETCEGVEEHRVAGLEIYAGVRERFGHLNTYLAYFHPYDFGSGMWHLLDDGLGDIYRDVRSELDTYRQGTDCAIVEAAFGWKILFLTHWGQHLVTTLTALHQMIAENLLANNDRAD